MHCKAQTCFVSSNTTMFNSHKKDIWAWNDDMYIIYCILQRLLVSHFFSLFSWCFLLRKWGVRCGVVRSLVFWISHCSMTPLCNLPNIWKSYFTRLKKKSMHTKIYQLYILELISVDIFYQLFGGFYKLINSVLRIR